MIGQVGGYDFRDLPPRIFIGHGVAIECSPVPTELASQVRCRNEDPRSAFSSKMRNGTHSVSRENNLMLCKYNLVKDAL